jgi:hypothetical protein
MNAALIEEKGRYVTCMWIDINKCEREREWYGGALLRRIILLQK